MRNVYQHDLAATSVQTVIDLVQKAKVENRQQTPIVSQRGFLPSLQHGMSKQLYAAGVPSIHIASSLTNVTSPGTALITGLLTSNLPMMIAATWFGLTPDKLAENASKVFQQVFKGTPLEPFAKFLFFDKEYIEPLAKKMQKLLGIYFKTAKTAHNLVSTSQKTLKHTQDLIETAKEKVIEDSEAFKKSLLYIFAPGPVAELVSPLIRKSTEIIKESTGSLIEKTGSWLSTKMGGVFGSVLGRIFARNMPKIALPEPLRKMIEENYDTSKKLLQTLDLLSQYFPDLKALKIATFLLKQEISKIDVKKVQKGEIAPEEAVKAPVINLKGTNEVVEAKAKEVGEKIGQESVGFITKTLQRLLTISRRKQIGTEEDIKKAKTEKGEIVEQVDITEIEPKAKKVYAESQQAKLATFKKIAALGPAIIGTLTFKQLLKGESAISEKLGELVSLFKKEYKESSKQRKETRSFFGWLKYVLFGALTFLPYLTTIAGAAKIITNLSSKEGESNLTKTVVGLGATWLGLKGLQKVSSKLGVKTSGGILGKAGRFLSKIPGIGAASKLIKASGPIAAGLTVLDLGYHAYKNIKKEGVVAGVFDTLIPKDITKGAIQGAVIGGVIGGVPGAAIGAVTGGGLSLVRKGFSWIKHKFFGSPIDELKDIIRNDIAFIIIKKLSYKDHPYLYKEDDRYTSMIFNRNELKQFLKMLLTVAYKQVKIITAEDFIYLVELLNSNLMKVYNFFSQDEKKLSLADKLVAKAVDKFVEQHRDIFSQVKDPNIFVDIFRLLRLYGKQKAQKALKDLKEGAKVSLKGLQNEKIAGFKAKNIEAVLSTPLANADLKKIANNSIDKQFLKAARGTVYFESRGRSDAINRKEWSFGLFQIHDKQELQETIKRNLDYLKLTDIDRPTLTKLQREAQRIIASGSRKEMVLFLKKLHDINPEVSIFAQEKVIHDRYWIPIKRELAKYGRENDYALATVLFDASIQHGTPNALRMLHQVANDKELRTMSEDELIRRYTQRRAEFVTGVANSRGWNVEPFISRVEGIQEISQTVKTGSETRAKNVSMNENQPLTPIIVNNVPQSFSQTTAGPSIVQNVQNDPFNYTAPFGFQRRFPSTADIG